MAYKIDTHAEGTYFIYRLQMEPDAAAEIEHELNLDEPNGDYWYALGRIAEQYGEREVAVADYRKVEKPEGPFALPLSSYTLAQMRLRILQAGDCAPTATRDPAARTKRYGAGES